MFCAWLFMSFHFTLMKVPSSERRLSVYTVQIGSLLYLVLYCLCIIIILLLIIYAAYHFYHLKLLNFSLLILFPVLFKQTGLSVFLAYFVAMGIPFAILIALSLCIQNAFLVSSQLWLARWSSSNVTGSSENSRYLGIYAGLGSGQAVFVCASSFLMAFASYKASTILHEKLLVNVMHLALSFFEVTPTGRILNRFSKDVDMVDSVIPQVLMEVFRSAMGVVGVVFIICYSTPLFLAVLLPLAVIYFLTQVRRNFL